MLKNHSPSSDYSYADLRLREPNHNQCAVNSLAKLRGRGALYVKHEIAEGLSN